MARPLAALLPGVLAAACLLSPMPAGAQASLAGQWSKGPLLPIAPIHNVVLPDGKVMMWGKFFAQTLFDPVTNSVSSLPNPGYDLFCAGHAYLADGRVLVPGGHIADFVGLPNTSIYHPATNSWSPVPDMNAGRWYPTVTSLGNGDALVVSGQIDTSIGVNPLPQVYQPATNSWRDLTSAQLNQNLYPMMFLAPNGRVVDVGPTNVTRWLDTSGTGSWSTIGNRKYPWRDYASAVMYDTGKILLAGGGSNPPTAAAEVIDLNVPAPAWRAVAPMSFARRHVNATLLPDGTVLATGGTSGSGHNNAAGAVYAAELWNPATETWTTLASGSVPRLYHSAAMLLPDGRVLVTGGDGYPDTEIFSPPYLFKGARPTMSGVPAAAGYGQQFTVQTPNAADISKVTLIRLAAVTHAFDENQRMNTLQFTRGSGSLNITTPAHANLAPPGHYWLFIVNSAGVPSVAGLVRLGGSASPPPPPGPAPALTSIAPSSATAGGPAFTLTVNGSNFVAGTIVRWNGAGRATTFVSSTQLTAAIPASDIAAAGSFNVSAANPDGAVSGVIPFTVSPGAGPVPALSSLSPSSATAGGPAFTLRVNGSNFVSGATVRWNGVARPTTFVKSTQLRASISAADIAAAGTANISVANPAGALSGTLAFTITGGATVAPILGSMSPTSATAGGPAFTLTVNGSNFVTGSSVLWNGVARSTTFVSSTQLRAAIPSSDIATAGSAEVAVANQDGSISGSLDFTISGTAPPPAATNLVANPGFENGLTSWTNWGNSTAVTGQALSGTSSLQIGMAAGGMGQLISAPLTVGTTYRVSASAKVASAPDIVYIGVKVLNSAGGVLLDFSRQVGTTSYSTATIDFIMPQGGARTWVYLWKNAGAGYGYVDDVSLLPASATPPPAPAPAVSALSPSSATAGGPAFTLTVNGSNFVSGATVRWNGAARSTTFASATQLTAAIPASDIAAAGSATVSVANPDGGVSGAFVFTISPSTAPALSSLSPSAATAGGPAFTLTVNGSNFVSGSTVRWNGAARPTTFVSASQVTAAIPSSDIATAGTANVSVANPDGAASGTLAFTVSSAAPATNLVTNAGFESGLTSWSNWGNSVAVTGESLTGTSSLRVGLPAGGMGQLIATPLTVGGNYRFSGSGKVATTPEVIYLGVKVVNSSGTVLLDQNRAITTTGYSTITIDFTVPAGAARTWVYIWKNAGSGYGYADDLSLVPR